MEDRFFYKHIYLNSIKYRYYYSYHKMGPFGQLSPIDRYQTFVINRYHLSKDNYSYINPANRGRKLFLQTHQLNYIKYWYFHLYHKMGPFGQWSPIGRARNFVINRNHNFNDSYSYINPVNRGRQLFLQTHIPKLHKISTFSFISKNGPFRTVISYWSGSNICYQQKSFM